MFSLPILALLFPLGSPPLYPGLNPAVPPASERQVEAGETSRAERFSQEPEEDDAAESKRRVFVLKDGRAVRGSAALRGTTWHLEQETGTVRLPASLVERVGEEKQLLREMKKRRRSIDSAGEASERQELARWTVDQGLHVEALTTIDNLLRRDSDDPVALELIAGLNIRLALPRRVDFPMDVPEGASREQIAALARFAGESMQPSTVENLSALLRRSEDRSALRNVLIAELHRPEEQRRETAALLMRRTLTETELLGNVEAPAAEGNGRELRALIGRAARDVAGTVRESAVRSLAYAGHPGVAAPFISALESKDAPRVAMHCAEALGRLAELEREAEQTNGEDLGRSIEEPLIRALAALAQSGSGGGTHAPAGSIFIGRQLAYVADFDVEIAGGSSIADPKIDVQNEGAALTARSLGISGYSTRLHLKVLDQALRRAAGAGPKKKTSPKAWAQWLSERDAQRASRRPPELTPDR